jgi:ornithine decarboxylase
LQKVKEGEEILESVVWGPSCCATDQISADLPLPRLEIGDWLVYKDTGAYTTCLGTSFNGFLIPVIVHCVSQETWYAPSPHCLGRN